MGREVGTSPTDLVQVVTRGQIMQGMQICELAAIISNRKVKVELSMVSCSDKGQCRAVYRSCREVSVRCGRCRERVEVLKGDLIRIR